MMSSKLKTIWAIPLLVWAVSHAGTPQGAPRRLEANINAMGTTFRLIVYGDDDNRLRTAIDQASAEIRRLNGMLSNYVSTSEWSGVNRLALDQPVKLSPELFGLLSDCLQYSRRSEGSFDISVGALMKVWGFYKGSGHLPQRSEIEGALARVGYKNIVLNKKARTVRFTKPGLELDPGGIGKGYTVDRVVAVLKENGITSALVSAGGSSIYGLGAPPEEPRGWRTAIRDPRDTSKTAVEVYLRDQSLSTSGNYEKFFYADGKLYSHVMDPRTGYPAQGVLSVSVLAPRTLDSEAWTKPYFILGREWAARHKAQGFRVFLCEDTSKSGSSPDPCAWLQ